MNPHYIATRYPIEVEGRYRVETAEEAVKNCEVIMKWVGKPHLDQDLKETLREFKRKSGIKRVIVFGSTAREESTKHSDVDVVLIDNRFEGKDFFERAKDYTGTWTPNAQ